MHRLKLHPLVLAALVASVATAVPAQSRAVLVTLAPPTYPPIARAAHISGDMVLTVTVNKDGAVTSATIDSGPALILLREATLASVKQSRFDCHDCSEAATNFQMAYSYQLELPTDPCADINLERLGQNGVKPYPHVEYSGLHVTVTDLSFSTCDPATKITQVRSIRCLYLWRCRAVSK